MIRGQCWHNLSLAAAGKKSVLEFTYLSRPWSSLQQHSQPLSSPSSSSSSSTFRQLATGGSSRLYRSFSTSKSLKTANMGSLDPSQQASALPTSTPVNQVSEAWHGPGPAAFDFRTDTITTPTLSMLRAIERTSLGDDVYHEDKTTTDFEAFIANLTGKEAALLAMSGTMGNQVALRSLLIQPPHSILAHHLSHIIQYEAGGCAVLSQAQVNGVIPDNGLYLTLEDIKKNVVLGNNVHTAPTRVISLENTLNGTITPLEEVKRISEFARAHNIKMHLDGARIWEVVASGAGSLPEFLACFDTAQLCLSKGLSAPIGSMIVGTQETINHCRWIRKMIGGGIRQAGIITAAARIAVDEAFGKGPNGEGGKLRESHKRAKVVESMWLHRGGRVLRPVETNMVWLDLDHSGVDTEDFIRVGKEEGINLMGNRLVLHYQLTDEAVTRLEKTMDRVLAEKKSKLERKSSDSDRIINTSQYR